MTDSPVTLYGSGRAWVQEVFPEYTDDRCSSYDLGHIQLSERCHPHFRLNGHPVKYGVGLLFFY